MDLDAYLEKHGIKNVEIAQDLHFTDGFISKLRKKVANPCLMNAVIICQYCNHEVTILDLMDQKALDAHLQKRNLLRMDLASLRPFYLSVST